MDIFPVTQKKKKKQKLSKPATAMMLWPWHKATLRSVPNCPLHFSFFFSGGRAIHSTYMDMQRKKPQVSNGRPSTAEAASYPHYLDRGRHKSLQRGNMSGKTSSPQGTCGLPNCPLLPLGLHCSQGSSPAPCPCPKGVWGWCMCQHRSRPCRPR